ncbi:putative vacuolar sorting ATPase [Xenorhabdus mauleonii]|uniref:ATPase family associated with various cellular activities (AAA) n=1 Tax=Xenorhabdus mauleonii TaxID=351675 RepID=A0A1I3LQB5_9GAMM|nr:ATP-binding protein [Xenorhabdus mauleonii]PHM45269.1 putative vacuolar sorting ATPase [Xenorhabdus mauleonii]SFI86938.1 ATPase family associated with various cellular activities (AAA) [Xenorhabdus mauleonii]
MDYPFINNGGSFLPTMSDLHWIYPHLERIDLRLQHYYYRKIDKYDSLPESFLLSPEQVKLRLAEPTGAPHWLQQENGIVRHAKIDESIDRLSLLVERFELTEFERDVLLLGLLPHFDDRYYALFAALNGNHKLPWPSFILAIELFSESQNDWQLLQNSFLPQSPLFSSRLLRFDKSENAVWSSTQFLTHSTIWHFLLEQRTILPPLDNCVYWHVSGTQIEYPQTLYHSFEQTILNDTDEVRPWVILRGKQDSARELAVSHIMASHDISTLILDFAQLLEMGGTTEIINLLAEVIREARLHDACLLIRNFALLTEKRKIAHQQLSVLFNQPGLRVVLLAAQEDSWEWGNHLSIVQIDMPIMTLADKQAMLQARLPDYVVQEIDLPRLCQRFSFTAETLPLILQEAAQYQRLREPTGKLEEIDLRKALNLRAQQNFGKLAQRITPKRSFQDLVVSDSLMLQLQEVIAAIHYREHILATGFQEKIGYGTGISALFHGESGTGKTMAAEVIAGQLGVDLIKVDLSTVVNKYIGETEKNISRIFDLAEADSGVLFFDEADALFGKRSETKDAQDRHANIEVSYLLQRLESYPGLVILATNNRSHLDSAFSRRFTFITCFTYPSEEERKKMWQIIWPDNLKLSGDIDFGKLAKQVDLTGANIRNIALLTSILAESEHCEQIENRHLKRAIKLELNKMGRLTF